MALSGQIFHLEIRMFRLFCLLKLRCLVIGTINNLFSRSGLGVWLSRNIHYIPEVFHQDIIQIKSRRNAALRV